MFSFYFIHINVLPTSMYGTMCLPGTHGVWESAQGILKLDLQIFVHNHVDVGKRTKSTVRATTFLTAEPSHAILNTTANHC